MHSVVTLNEITLSELRTEKLKKKNDSFEYEYNYTELIHRISMTWKNNSFLLHGEVILKEITTTKKPQPMY